MEALHKKFMGLSMAEVRALIEDEHYELRKKEVLEHFGTLFTKCVGVDELADLPFVDAEKLGLNVYEKYPKAIVTPKMLKHSAVRGMMYAKNEGKEFTRPFVAIKIVVKNKENLKVEGIFVEVIHPRFDHRDLSQRENFVTAGLNKGDDGSKFNSMLYVSGGMSNEQMQAVGRLLKGEEIDSPVAKTYSIKMVSEVKA